MRPILKRASMLVTLFFTASLLATLAPAGASNSGGSAGPSERYHEDLVLVAFAPGTPGEARASAHASERGEVENTMEWLNLDVVRLPEGVDPAAAAVRYERNPNVAYAHPNWEVSLLSTPNDTLYVDEWGLHNTGQSVTGSLVKGVADKDIDAPEGWSAAFGSGSFPSSGGTRVGILDTGIDLSHVDLFNKTKACANAITGTGIIINGSCSDDNLHGTHVAGTVGAITNNSVGVAGVAPNSEFAIFKGLDAAGVGFYADIIAGIHWLHTTGGARIVSMSLGGPQDDALDRELSEAAASGALLIAAAGNDGDSTANYPAYHADVMSVAAIDAAGKRAWFSNCNSDVEIAAPGVDVWSTLPGNTYGSLNGTSMATPHVSGVAAMVMWAKGSDASQTRNTMKSTAEGDGGCNSIKVVNLAGAVGGSTTTEPTEPEPTDPGAIAGKVTDGRSKAAISGATVDCGTAGSATTDSTGNYSITNVTPSTYTCTASASGYRSKSQNVTVNSGQTTTANFALRPQR